MPKTAPSPGLIECGAVFSGKHPDDASFKALHRAINAASARHLGGMKLGAVTKLHLVLRFPGQLKGMDGSLHARDLADMDHVGRVTTQQGGQTLGLQIAFQQALLDQNPMFDVFAGGLNASLERVCRSKHVRDHTDEFAALKAALPAFLDEVSACIS